MRKAGYIAQVGGVNPHSPPNALYAKVENDSLELRLEASRRKDATMAWLMMSMSDKHLLKEADIEYDRISKDESINAIGSDPFGGVGSGGVSGIML